MQQHQARQRAQRATRLFAHIRTIAVLGVLLMAASGCGSPFGSAPMPTPGPPTPTPTIQQRIVALARYAAGPNVQHVDATYGAADGTVAVTVTLGGSVPVASADVSAMQERVKTMCFQAQKALWTSGISLRSATVTVVGPIMDQYAERALQAYVAVVLSSGVAAKLDWGTLTPDTAWDKYDNAYLRPSYYDVD